MEYLLNGMHSELCYGIPAESIIQCTASLLKHALVNTNMFSQILSEMEISKS